MSRRAHIPLKTKLAATILAWDYARGSRNISYERAKTMTADEIIRTVEFDHWPIYHWEGGPDEPWNLEPLFIEDHREKTAKDISKIAKGKRLRRKEAVHKAKRTHFLAGMTPENHDYIPVEKPTGGHRIRSRGFDTTKTRTVRGRVVPRKQRRENYG